MKLIFHFNKLVFFAGIFFIPSASFSQIATSSKQDSQIYNQVVLLHYTINELQQVAPEKLIAINYYYTESFILDSIACNQCRIFDRCNFDVSPFEQFRKQSERYVREYNKYGYKLTLLSKDELQYQPVR